MDLLPKLFIFFGSIIVITFYGYVSKVGEFFYDAGRYWYLSTFFRDVNGDFSLLLYTEELRGYLFPLILFVIRELFGGFLETYSLLIPLFNSLLMSTISLVLVPAIVQDLFKIKFNWIRRLILLGIFFFIWRGYVFYPLSDIPALFLVVTCIFFVVKVLKEHTIKPKLFFYAFLMGLSLSAAYFIRPVYLVNAPIVIVMLVMFLLKFIHKGWKQVIMSILLGLCLFAGMILPALPQYYINSHNFDRKSFMISSGLYTDQLIWGLRMQKYETNVDTDVYQHKSVVFEDPQYQIIYGKNADLYNEKLTNGDVKYILMHMTRNYPFDVITIYFRHLFNGLDVRYSTVYLFDVYKISLPIMLLNYTLIFLFLFLKKKSSFLKLDMNKIVTVALLTLPVLLTLPGAVEPRFFLPLHLLVYTVVVMTLPFKKIDIETLTKYVKTPQTYKWLISYLFFLTVCLTLSALVGTTLKDSGIILNN